MTTTQKVAQAVAPWVIVVATIVGLGLAVGAIEGVY